MTGTEHAIIRKTLGITQLRWAALMDVYRTTVTEWEKGDRPVPGAVELALLEARERPELIEKWERFRNEQKS